MSCWKAHLELSNSEGWFSRIDSRFRAVSSTFWRESIDAWPLRSAIPRHLDGMWAATFDLSSNAVHKSGQAL